MSEWVRLRKWWWVSERKWLKINGSEVKWMNKTEWIIGTHWFPMQIFGKWTVFYLPLVSYIFGKLRPSGSQICLYCFCQLTFHAFLKIFYIKCYITTIFFGKNYLVGKFFEGKKIVIHSKFIERYCELPMKQNRF